MFMKAAVPVLILLVLATGAVVGQDKKAPAGLEQFKQLAGEWAGKEVKGLNEGKEVRASYKVTAAGSAVVETLFPGSPHEMVTVIHPDGNDLILTHYCALGNQPQMKAPGGPEGNKVAFKFVRATNLKSEKDMHMHDVTFTFVDKDTLRSEWTHYKDGKAAGQVIFEMKRQK
jgi:hypothetical protein